MVDFACDKCAYRDNCYCAECVYSQVDGCVYGCWDCYKYGARPKNHCLGHFGHERTTRAWVRAYNEAARSSCSGIITRYPNDIKMDDSW